MPLILAACGGGGPKPGPDAGTDAGAALTLSGVIVDPAEQPVSGAAVAVGGSHTTSGKDGRFALPIEKRDARTLVVTATGFARAERRLELDAGWRALGAIMLTPLTASGEISPAGGKVGDAARRVVVTVPAGAFARTVKLELTLLELGDPLTDELRLPLPVPAPPGGAVAPLFALVIDAEGEQPAHALTVSLTGVGKLPADVEIPVGRYDPTSGAWVDAGLAHTAASGALELSLSHLSTFAAALPALPTSGTVPPEVSSLTHLPSPFLRGEPRVDPKSGALQLGVDLPPLTRRGERLTLTLFHDSRTSSPILSLPIALPGAQPADRFWVTARTALAVERAEITVAKTVSDKTPAVVVSEPRPVASATKLAALPKTGSHLVEARATRKVQAALHRSRSKSFANPKLGTPIAGAAPVSIPLRTRAQHAVALDNRAQSPFGRGWHLRGLTRLVQPWCKKDEATLAGGYASPALHFGKSKTLYLDALEPLLVAAGLKLDDLASPPLLARVDQAIYVGVRRTTDAEIWRLDLDKKSATRVVGGGAAQSASSCAGAAKDLFLRELTGLGPAPDGDGVLFSTESCVLQLKGDGSVQRLAGGKSSGGVKPGSKVKLAEVDFAKKLQQVTFGRAAGVWVIETSSWGAFIARGGTLEPLRTRVTHPHGLVAAIDAKSRLLYTVPGSPCIYIFDDGLTDKELFPSCKQGYPKEFRDGPQDSATTGQIGAMTFDSAGNLWLLDATFSALRRMDSDGVLTTIAGGRGSEPSGVGGPAAEAALGALFSLAADAPDQLALGGVKRLLGMVRGAGDALLSLTAGDYSKLTRRTGGGFDRVLADGTVERYNERGLLTHRGRPDEPGLDFVYRSWRAPKEKERCGVPAAPPLLERIELASEAVFQFQWNQARLIAVTDAAGRRTTLTWDNGRLASITPEGGKISFRYDGDGRVTERTSAGPAGQLVTWRYGYSEGRVTQVEIPGRGKRTFASAEGLATIAQSKVSTAGIARGVSAGPAISSVSTATGAKAQIGLGEKALKVTDPAGNTTEIELDPAGRLLRERRPDGTVLAITHDPAGHILEIYNEASHERWRYGYDQAGLLIQRVDPAGRLTKYSRDSTGRLLKRSDPGGASLSFAYAASGAAEGLPTRITDALGRTHTVDYDRRGNIVKLVAPGGETMTITRDAAGRAVKVLAPSGLLHGAAYDARDGLTLQSLGNPSDQATLSYKRVIADGWQSAGSHVPASALVEAKDPLGRRWIYTRGLAFETVKRDTPGEGPVQQTFDKNGRRTRLKTADGSAEVLTYDGKGRLTRRAFEGPAAGAWLNFSYDGLGRVATLADPLLTETRTFVAGLGWTRVTVAPTPPMSEAARFSLTRSRPAPAVESQTLGLTRFTLHRDYDDQIGRVELERTDRAGSKRDVLVMTRDASRKLTVLTRGNGTVTRRTYDAAGRVIAQEERTPAGTVTLTWTYDAAGRPATRKVDGTTRTYSYDARGRLAGCSDTGESYTYDKNGARASAKGKSYRRDARGRLTSDGVNSYAYDASGRRIGGGGLTLTYGPGGRLAKVKRGATTLASYRYDGSGRRVQRTTPAGSWTYGYLPETDRPVRVVQPDGTRWHLAHAWASAAYAFAVSEAGAERYVHLDPFDRVIGVSDKKGVLTRVEEACFGARTSKASVGGLEVGFHGMPWDKETGLYYTGGRYYDPATGEFLSPDPKGLEAGPDPWGYAGGNPVTIEDPSGRFFFALASAVIVGAVIANGIRRFAQSAAVRRARKSYQDMTELDSDDRLESAERAHRNLYRASKKGGQVAVKSVKKAIDAVTDPAEKVNDLANEVQDAVESAL